MHVLIIPSWYPTSISPVSGSFFREQAHALSKSGCKVGVIAPNIRSFRILWHHPLELFNNGSRFYKDKDIPTFMCSGWNYTGRLPGGFFRRNISAGMSLCKQYTEKYGMPDLVHAHSALAGGLIAEKIRQKYGIKFVVTEHLTTFLKEALTSRQKNIGRKVFKNANRRVAVSRKLSDVMQKTFPEAGKWDVIPNIVNDIFFRPELTAKTVKTFKFISVGLLIDRKRHRDLITAFARSFQHIKDVALYIVGDGIMRRELLELSANLGVGDKVIFTGQLTRPAVMNIMKDCDVLVSTSQYETFGVVLIEALALGKPIISTESGGPCEIVNKSNGVLVPIGDCEKLSAEMKSMYMNSSSFYSPQKIREDCRAQYSEKSVVDRLLKVYETVLD